LDYYFYLLLFETRIPSKQVDSGSEIGEAINGESSGDEAIDTELEPIRVGGEEVQVVEREELGVDESEEVQVVEREELGVDESEEVQVVEREERGVDESEDNCVEPKEESDWVYICHASIEELIINFYKLIKTKPKLFYIKIDTLNNYKRRKLHLECEKNNYLNWTSSTYLFVSTNNIYRHLYERALRNYNSKYRTRDNLEDCLQDKLASLNLNSGVKARSIELELSSIALKDNASAEAVVELAINKDNTPKPKGKRGRPRKVTTAIDESKSTSTTTKRYNLRDRD
jgi:hypothetical protein